MNKDLEVAVMIVIMFSFKTDLFSQNNIRGRRKQKVNIGLLKQNFRTRGELRTHLFQSPHQRQEEALFTLMLYANLFISRTSSPTSLPNLAQHRTGMDSSGFTCSRRKEGRRREVSVVLPVVGIRRGQRCSWRFWGREVRDLGASLTQS